MYGRKRRTSSQKKSVAIPLTVGGRAKVHWPYRDAQGAVSKLGDLKREVEKAGIHVQHLPITRAIALTGAV